jgi:hypothetical protein
MPIPGGTNDHIVPVMYLKRFAHQSGRHQVIHAAPADSPGKDFTQSVRNVGSAKGFYWGTDPEGIPHHHMEEFLGVIEGAAAPAFRFILDKGDLPTDSALPHRWPTRPDVRDAIAWWISAQILRTARQRERLWKLDGQSLALPPRFARNNSHLEYIARQVAPLAFLIANRPWGIGFTNLCLYTSDVPVQVINGQDDDDQLKAASYWDIYLPLDPHRFLYLPGSMHKTRRELMRDHLINLPGGLAMALNGLMVATAHRHVFFCPEHDPRMKMPEIDVADTVRQRNSSAGIESVLHYDAFDAHAGIIERRWLERHTWDEPSAQPEREAESAHILGDLQRMIEHLESAKRHYNQI